MQNNMIPIPIHRILRDPTINLAIRRIRLSIVKHYCTCAPAFLFQPIRSRQPDTCEYVLVIIPG